MNTMVGVRVAVVVLTVLCVGVLTEGVQANSAKNDTETSGPHSNNTKDNSTLSTSSNDTQEETKGEVELSTDGEMKEKFGVGEVGSLTTEADEDLGTTTTPVTTEEPTRKAPLLTFVELEAIPGPWSCDSPIFCRGPLLDAVQRSGIFPDSKTFVDMPLKDDPDVVLKVYEALVKERGPLSVAQLKTFIDKYFSAPGEELEAWTLPDWKESPEVLEKIADPALRRWAEWLHGAWSKLGRQIKSSVPANSSRHSLLHIPNGFVVPGDRFREFYYWDTYWIVKGLLVSGMPNTTRGVIENLLYMVKEYGMVPNGGRVYYKNRSQPPLLASMVDAYYKATGDAEFVKENLYLLEREYDFWATQRTVTVTKGDKEYRVARYSVNMSHPRAEGYLEDLHTVHGLTPNKAAVEFSHLASGAESGWDYSTRWFTWTGENEYTMGSIKTADIVPVDLNTFLYLTETAISKFAALAGESDKADRYAKLAEARRAAIQELLWDEAGGTWYDYDLATNSSRRDHFFMSNLTPLLMRPDSTQVTKVMQYLQNERVLDYPGGIPTSTLVSGQQWDMPNAWPPLVEILVNGLASAESETAQQLAVNISRTWVATNYAAWAKTGHMYEKYMVRKLGAAGRGGEYKVQVGFGWTNGVILELLSRYGSNITAPDVDVVSGEGQVDQGQGPSPEAKVSFVFIPVVLLVVAVLFFICFMRRNIKQRAKRPSTGRKYTSAPFHKFDN